MGRSIGLLILTLSVISLGAAWVYTQNQQAIISQQDRAQNPAAVAPATSDSDSEHRMWVKPVGQKWYIRGNAVYPTREKCVRDIPFVLRRDPRFRGRQLTCCPTGIDPNVSLRSCSPPYKH